MSAAQRLIHKPVYRRVMVAGKAYTYDGQDICFDQISDAGWISITSVGAENLYFLCRTDSGEELRGWCKCL